MRGAVNGPDERAFILDLGSPLSAISGNLVPREHTAPVCLRIGARRSLDFEYKTLDARQISSRNGIEIAGAVGYSVFRDMVLAIDYRDGMIALGK